MVRALIAATGWVGVLLGGCGRQAETAPRAEAPAVAVQTALVRAAQVPVTITTVGTTEPYARAVLSTRLMGRITHVDAEAGDHVRPGRALVRIASEDLVARRQQAEAGLGEAEAVLANAARNLERLRALRHDQAAPQQALDEAETSHARAVAAAAAARQAVREAEVALGYSQVQAPWNGVVVEKLAQVGDLSSPGAPLLVLEQQDSIKVTVEVNESHVAYVAVGQEVDVQIEALSSEPVRRGRVESLVPAADPSTRTFQARLVVPNADGRVASGMFARVGFPRGQRPALLVPRRAIVEQGQLQGVYTVVDGRARLRWVRLGPTFGEEVEVLSGLGEGVQVVVGGLAGVRDGRVLEVKGDA
ncbi:MAG: efflux RND transporter periplasmic adaptor subunit [Candidatus Latescibacterota bacterium]